MAIIKGWGYTPQQTGYIRKRLEIAQNYRKDAAEDYTDHEYQIVLRKLKKVYSEAAGDLKLKAESWKRAHEARVRKYQAQVARGEITEADYQAWMRGQVFQGEVWNKKRQQMAEAMADVDAQAMRIVNEGKTRVFAENANYTGYQLEHGGGADYGFGVYDSAAVARLVREEPRMLPMPKVDKYKDVAWYDRIIENAVTQGILQGESLEDITYRIAMDTADKSLSAMRRNARTAYTGAQNAGRLEAMRQADGLGIKTKKQWRCTLDNKTRETHAEMDGQTVEWEEPFLTPLGPLMYPGDPSGEPANVYNCRCKVEKVFAKYPDIKRYRRDMDGQIVANMSYKEWLEAKNRAGTEAGTEAGAGAEA